MNTKKLPVKVDDNIDYQVIEKQLIEHFIKLEKKFEKVIEFIEVANREYKKIEPLNLDKFVLHGDLHHENIILDGDTYKAIDPHGRIGEKYVRIHG